MDHNKKNAPKNVIDSWNTDKADWENISIPRINASGKPHDTIWDNYHEFKAGETHLVPPDVAKHLRDRLEKYQYGLLRLNSSAEDLRHLTAENLRG